LEKSVAVIGAKVVDVQAKLGAQKDLYMRALADLETFKKRAQKDREDMRTLMTKAIRGDLFWKVDHFELGLRPAESHGAAGILARFGMMFDQLKKVLASHELSEVIPLNQRFDRHEHECVCREYMETMQENTVTRVIRKGVSGFIRPRAVAVSTQQLAEGDEYGRLLYTDWCGSERFRRRNKEDVLHEFGQ
jgi:molecular chaperone GrpE